MNKKKYILIAAAFLMLGAVTVKPAMAFLTDAHGTEGNTEVYLEDRRIEIIPHERIEDDTKVIKVENNGEMAVFTRVKVLTGRTHEITLDTVKSDEHWKYDIEDDYYYYDSLLDAGETSGELYVKVAPGDSAEEKFKVVVVAEAARPNADRTEGDWEGTIAKETSEPSQNEGGN